MRFDGLISERLRHEMVEIAREFRKTPTASEELLWQRVRGRQLAGAKFRRQQPIGSFVVDFYCDEAALIVEVDGPVHELQQRADGERRECLESLGLKMLRLSADVVENDMRSALTTIRRCLEERQQALSLRERDEPSAQAEGSG